MAYNNKDLSIVNDDPCEGKPFEFPQCVSCEYCEGDYCKSFGCRRLEIIAKGMVDLFNCPNFKSKY